MGTAVFFIGFPSALAIRAKRRRKEVNLACSVWLEERSRFEEQVMIFEIEEKLPWLRRNW